MPDLLIASNPDSESRRAYLLRVPLGERKSVPDLVSTLTSGRMRYALGELAALPRAAVVVEERYSKIYKQTYFRPALVADLIAECQVRWPSVPIVFCETRSLAEEWTYRYLAAAQAWAFAEPAAVERITGRALQGIEDLDDEINVVTARPTALGRSDHRSGSAAEIRAWARAGGFAVPERGRIPTSVRRAWERANAPT